MRRHQSDKPVILFTEVDDRDAKELRTQRAQSWDIVVSPEHFEDIAPEDLPLDTQILSPFVHSKCTAGNLTRLPNLKAIATRSTGYDHIDLSYCKAKGIAVSNVPSYGENTVAEHTFGLILALTRKIHRCYERTIRGDFSLQGLRGIDLQGRTFGCLGTGRIGLNALRIAGGFQMHRIAHDPFPKEEEASRMGFQYVDFDFLLQNSDVLSLHLPYNVQTHHIINDQALAQMRQGAIIINTARGALIDSMALIKALRKGHLGGAGLDVLEEEAAVYEEAELLTKDYDVESLKAVIRNHTLLRMPNVIITPHVAFNSEEALGRILMGTIENIESILEGNPKNVVSMS